MSDRKAQLRSRPARQGPQGQNRWLRTAASREAEGEAHVLHPGRSVPQLLRARCAAARVSPAKFCCSSSSAGWTTLSTAWALRWRAVRPASWYVTGTSTVNGRKVDIPSFQVHRWRRDRSTREQQQARCCWRAPKEFASHQAPPNWLEVDRDGYKGRVASAAEARRHQPADQRAADRRTLQQVVGTSGAGWATRAGGLRSAPESAGRTHRALHTVAPDQPAVVPSRPPEQHGRTEDRSYECFGKDFRNRNGLPLTPKR